MEDKINFLLENAPNIEDEFLSSHLLNYICVLISGYLEQSMQKVIDNYKTSSHCSTHECKDSIKSMRKIQNVKWCAMREIFMKIDENILGLLKSDLVDKFDIITCSIDNIVKTRHKIAHGEDVTNLTIETLNADFTNIKQFIQKSEAIFGCL
ncbi:MAG: HEPN domain-containing protein [Campylobacterota bacterium]|nr:HEPN domain-containing protein [Campylobacterota bacterium]